MGNPPPDLPRQASITAPFFAQEAYQCGPAALAGLLGQRGIALAPEALADEVYVPDLEGSLQNEIAAAIRRRGLLAYRLPYSEGYALEPLLRILAAGHPALVLQNLGLGAVPRWHYAVATGYDLGSGKLVLNSGTHESLRLGLAPFEHSWKKADYWALLALLPDTVPVFAAPDAWLAAALDLETTGQLPAAHAAYRSALRQWPGNEHALLGAGNTSLALELYEEAANQLYRLATTSEILAGTGWNNLAYALRGLGCAVAARQSAATALALNSNNAAIAGTVRELQAQADNGAPSATCALWRERTARQQPLP